MKYGERLKLARERSDLTQEALAEIVGMKQPSLAYLENPDKNASGSEFTVRLAKALGVSVEWLDDEIGEMIPKVYSTTNPVIGEAMAVMEKSPDYVQKAAAEQVFSTCELAKRAKANGTDG
jgi:transcriptional regulator with XRE-family HTH domain